MSMKPGTPMPMPTRLTEPLILRAQGVDRLHISVMTKSRPRLTSVPSFQLLQQLAVAVHSGYAKVRAPKIYPNGIVAHNARLLLSFSNILIGPISTILTFDNDCSNDCCDR